MAKTLLLADDSVTIQKVVGMTFAGEDFDITTVDNGEDALARARQRSPDVILADVVMPRRNGYELCEAIKSDPSLRHIPVLLLAGTFEAFDEARARAVRADGHIAKPFESQSLIDKVKEVMGSAATVAAPPPQGVTAQATPPRASPPVPGPAAVRPVAVPRAGAPLSGARPPAGAPPFTGRPPAGNRPSVGPPPSGRPPFTGAPPVNTRPPTPPVSSFRPVVASSSPPPGSPPFKGTRSTTVPVPPSSVQSAKARDPYGLDVPAPTAPAAKGMAPGPVPYARAAPSRPEDDFSDLDIDVPATPPASTEPRGTPPVPAKTTHPAELTGLDELDFGEPPAMAVPPRPAVDEKQMGSNLEAIDFPLVEAEEDEQEIVLAPTPQYVSRSKEPGRPVPGEPTGPRLSEVPPAPDLGRPPAQVEKAVSDGGEAQLREAISHASREVIERIAWEVVPQLAEAIIREQVDRLVKARQQ